MICVECNTMLYGVQRVAEISVKIEEKLTEIFEFLQVKASQNIILGSYPFLNEEKYRCWVSYFLWKKSKHLNAALAHTDFKSTLKKYLPTKSIRTAIFVLCSGNRSFGSLFPIFIMRRNLIFYVIWLYQHPSSNLNFMNCVRWRNVASKIVFLKFDERWTFGHLIFPSCISTFPSFFERLENSFKWY